MGKISDLAVQYPTQESRDSLRDAVDYARKNNQANVHDGSSFIPVEKAEAILKVLKDQPVKE